MKKLFRFVMLAASAACLFSCEVKELAGDPVDPQDNHDGMELQLFNAVSEMTKTTINGSYQTLWAKDDEIKVYWNGGDGYATLDGEGGETSGQFSGWLPVGKTGSYAVYPRSAAAGVEGTTVSVTIPAAQTGTSEAAISLPPRYRQIMTWLSGMSMLSCRWLPPLRLIMW